MSVVIQRREQRSIVTETPHFLAALMATTALVSVAFVAVPARAQTWQGATSDFNTAGNWSTATVPTATAVFANTGLTSLTFSTNTAVGALQFDAGAPGYTLTSNAAGQGLALVGSGILDNSANAPVLASTNGGTIQFQNSASAGDATLTAGGASNAFLQFFNTSSGANANVQLSANGILAVETSAALSIGSLSGTTGSDVLFSGAVPLTLTIGGLNGNTTFAGNVGQQGGAVGSLVKVGTGTLTLSGVNTSSGGTTVSSGTLAISNNAALGSGGVTLSPGTTLALEGVQITNSVAVSGDPTISVTGANAMATITGSGTVNILGASGSATTDVLTLTAANSYTAATDVGNGTTANAVTLKAGVAGAFSATSLTTVTANSILDLGGFAQTINTVSLTGGTIQDGSLTSAVGISSTGGTISGLAGSTGVTTTAGTTQLLGTNAYTGATNINGGSTLQAGANGALSQTSLTTVTGTLDLNSHTADIDAVDLTGGLIENGSLTSLNGISSTGGTISGLAGSTGVTTTAGTTQLLGTNAYTGATNINGGSTLQANANGAFSQTSLTTVVGTLNLNSHSGDINTVNLNGGLIENGSLTNANGVTSTGGSIFNLISSGALTTTSGTTTLTGTNQFSSVTNGAGAFLINSGVTTDDLTNAGTVTNKGTYNAAVAANSGAITNNSGATWNGLIKGPNTGTITNAVGASWSGDIKAGANVAGGIITNLGTWTGAGDNDGGALTNSGTWTGAISNNSGTFLNNGSGMVTAGLTVGGGTATNLGAISGGVAVNAGVFETSGTVNGGVANSATVNAAGSIAGGVTNSGAFTVTGALNNMGGDFTNSGLGTLSFAPAAFLTFQGIGTLTNSSTATPGVNIGANDAVIATTAINNLAGATITSTGTMTAPIFTNAGTANMAGTLDGAIDNKSGGVFNVTGVLMNNGKTFTNESGAALNVQASGDVTTLAELDNSGTTTVSGQINATTIKQLAGTFTNNGIAAASASIVISGGDFENNVLIGGSVVNSATFNNNLNAAVSGNLTNTGGTAGNAGTIVGNATVTGGVLNTSGAIDGSLANSAVVNAAGSIGGGVTNSGAFTVNGALDNKGGNFTNSGTGTLSFAAANLTYQNIGTLTNGATATANVSGTITAATFTNAGTANVSGTVNADTSNSGVLNGTGVISGNLVNTGSVVVGAAGAPTLGAIFKITGNYSGATGTLYTVADLSNASAPGVVKVTGAVAPGSQLNIAISNNNGANVFFNQLTIAQLTAGMGKFTDTAATQSGLAAASNAAGSFYTYNFGQTTGGQGIIQTPKAAIASAPLTQVASTISALNSSFFQNSSAFLGQPQNPEPNHFAMGVWNRDSASDTTVSSASTVVGGVSSAPRSSVNTSLAGFQFGLDGALFNIQNSGMNAHFGLTTGDVFASSSDHANPGVSSTTQIPFVGAYAAVTGKGFAAVFGLRYDSYQMNLNNTVENVADAPLNGHGLTFSTDLSYVVPVGTTMFVEPSTGVYLSHASMDTQSFGAGSNAFGGLDGALGRLGLRAGFAVKAGNFILQPFAAANVFHEFGGDATTTFTPAAGVKTPLLIDTTNIGTFGQGSLGVGFQAPGTGWTGYARGDVRDGAEVKGWTLTAGLRYSF